MSYTVKPPSRAPAVLATLVIVAAVIYLAFFRGGSAEPAAAEAPAEVKVVAQPVNDPPPKSEPVRKPADPVPPPQDGSALKTFRDLHAAGKWREARTELARLFAAELSDADRAELAEKGLAVHQKIVASLDPQDIETYEIQSGDSLTKIGAKFKHLKGCYGPILLLNDMKDPNATLRLGRKLKITKGTWSIVVDKSLFKLFLCYEGAPVKCCTVAIGTDAKTPAATFKVGNKNPKPSWYPPSDQIAQFRKDGVPIPIPYGHEKNPLGEYWIALDHDDHSGLGIHGTNNPKSLGSKASNGCVRMDNTEVLMIAWSTWPGMTVTIVE